MTEATDPTLDKLASSRRTAITLCKDVINDADDNMTVEGGYSNANLLYLLEDLMDMTRDIALNQLQLFRNEVQKSHPETKICASKISRKLEERWEEDMVEIAQKITRLNLLTEEAAHQVMRNIERTVSKRISKLYFQLQTCLGLGTE